MVSQKSHASDQETFGKPTKRKVGYNLPKDLEPCQRYVYELDGLSEWSSATSTSSETFSLVYSSKYRDLMFKSSNNTALQSASSRGVEREDVPQALVTPNTEPNDIVIISDDEASESHEKVVHVSPHKGYKSSSKDLLQAVVPKKPSPSYDLESEKEFESMDSSPCFDDSESEKEFESMDSSPCFDDSESEKEFESMDSSPCFDDSESGDSIMSMYQLTPEEEVDMCMDFVGLTSKHEFTDLTEYVASNFEPPYLPLNMVYSTTGSYQIMEDDIFDSDTEESFSRIPSKKVPNATEKPVPKQKVTICNPYKLRRKRAIKSTPNIDTIKRIKKNQ